MMWKCSVKSDLSLVAFSSNANNRIFFHQVSLRPLPSDVTFNDFVKYHLLHGIEIGENVLKSDDSIHHHITRMHMTVTKISRCHLPFEAHTTLDVWCSFSSSSVMTET